MYKLLVTIQVADFQALNEFEKQASLIMSDYQGEIVSAFETSRNSAGSGEEVHIVEFQSESDFSHYKNDPRLLKLENLREKAISETSIKICSSEKSYS
jgi:uncharacterized protein (DUF1330 family)